MASPSTPFKSSHSGAVNTAGTPPPPVIPTSYLAPNEQRFLLLSLSGLVETIKVWDILAPYFIPSPEPTWSSHLRVHDFWSTLGWTGFELAAFALVSLLRIPMLSPSPTQLLMLCGLLVAWNVGCWFVAEPAVFFTSIHLIGPVALGGEWYWSWWYAFKRWKEPSHLEGVHRIRLLPYSTATLNPLSLSYCIPPDAPAPLYVPVIFNNSIPHEVSYFIRSLDTGHTEVKTVLGSSLKRSHRTASHLQLTNGEVEDEEDNESDFDPLSALVKRPDSGSMEIAKLPSVKPPDSLSLIPPKLSSTQSVLFLIVDKPSVVSLQSARDKRGDRFHISPHKEAIVVECATGGHFVDEQHGKLIPRPRKQQSAEIRCVGQDETALFEARGVGALRVGWRKKTKSGTQSGAIEGIEDEDEPIDQLALIRRDKVAKTHTVPLRIQHNEAGVVTVSLTSVTDAMHNTYNPSGHSAEKVYNVLARPTVHFECGMGREILEGKDTTLPFKIEGMGTEALELVYSFTSLNGEAKQVTKEIRRKGEVITASEPGMYTLLEINGPCTGNVMEPSTCVVTMIPPPKLDMKVTTLHECALDVGSTVDFDFKGSPPFSVEYTEKHDRHRSYTRTARFQGHTGQIVLRPEREGQYTYTFLSLSDGKYTNIKLDEDPIEQTVHPLANVELFGEKRRRMFACSGNKVEVELEAKGSNPLSLTYLMTWNGHTKNETWYIPPGKQKLFFTVPEELSEEGGRSGKMSISLLTIEDGNGCSRKLEMPNIDVDIDRKRPTARFAQSGKVTVTEGEAARAALRLTGIPPWEISYTLNGKDERRVTLHDPNNHLIFDQKGVFRLTQVRDLHCAGTVATDASTYEIDYKARPTLQLVPNSQVQLENGVYSHKGLCAGEEDQAAVRFVGHAPYELGYRYTTEGRTSRHHLKSAQDTGILHLSSEPGHHRYDLLDIKDGNYASTPISLVLEHVVYGRPSVTFVRPNTGPLCLDSTMLGDARVKLSGKAPFKLDVAVKKPASSKVESFKINVESFEWTLNLPYEVKDIGRYEVTIVSISDASGCQQDVRESDILSTIVEVVESAKIVPVSSSTDLCVGDTLEFVLQGKAPWVIEYEWGRKKHKVTSSAARFTRYAEEKGTFAVKSVALKDNQCKREIRDLERHIHPLPSVKIQEGVQALRAGDEPAAFSVRLEGTPPFGFTYTRSEMVGSKSKVIETQTVSDIMEKEYTISSSAPGDYAVISVSDRYCRYPPLSRSREGK